MHAVDNSLPINDAQQDYELLEATENATHTRLKFQRKLSTCDKDDFAINVNLHWSFMSAIKIVLEWNPEVNMGLSRKWRAVEAWI